MICQKTEFAEKVLDTILWLWELCFVIAVLPLIVGFAIAVLSLPFIIGYMVWSNAIAIFNKLVFHYTPEVPQQFLSLICAIL